MPDKIAAIKTINLSKAFGGGKGVSGVDLTIEKGEAYALIGPNGAGKTTLIKMFTGLLAPSAGTVDIFGQNIAENPIEAKKHFGYVPDDPSFYDYLTGKEFLALTGKLRRIEHQKLSARIEELTDLFPIKEILNERMGSYSRGNKQKLSFLAALLPQPDLLIIDEPIVGLDPLSIKIFGDTLKDFSKNGGTVFFATHILSFAKDYADRIGLMDEGKIVKEEKVSSKASLEKFYQEETKQ